MKGLPNTTVMSNDQKELKMRNEEVRLKNAESEVFNFIFSIPFQLSKVDNAVHKFEHLRLGDEFFRKMLSELQAKKYKVQFDEDLDRPFSRVGPLSASLELVQ